MQETLYQDKAIEVENEIVEPEFYVPTEAECVEMMEMYRIDSQDEFDEWLVNLSNQDLITMRRAIDDIRRIMKNSHMSLPVQVLAAWIDLD